MAKKKKVVAKKDNTILWIIISLVSFVLFVVSILKLGLVGTALSNLLSFVLGDFYWINLISIIVVGIYYIYAHSKSKVELKIIIGIILLNVALAILSASLNPVTIESFEAYCSYVASDFSKIFSGVAELFKAGIIANALYAFFNLMFDKLGTYIIVVVLFVISMLLIIPIETYKKFFFETKDNLEQAKEQVKEKHEERKLAKQNVAQNNGVSSFQNIQLNTYDEHHEENRKNNGNSSPYFIDVAVPEEKKPVLDNSEFKQALDANNEKAVNDDKQEGQETKSRILEYSAENGEYKLPPLQLLENITSKNSNINRTSADIKGQKVIEILHNFGIEATLVNTHVGPSVTKFEIKPDSGVKVSKIQAISDNIKMELAAKDIRIEAPIPGRSAVGIEIPNVEPSMVRMNELMKNLPSDKKNSKLLFALGKDLLGKNIYCELDKMPHLLIAGATGSGKSVCINTIITSYLMNAHPDEVKLVLIDPKKVEFTPYHDIPHLLWPVITDATMASSMLKKIVVIMEERYEAFADAGVRNIKGFNELADKHNNDLKEDEKPMNKMPYIVVIVDELADLMMIAGKEVESSIQRITQLARASGIHLIVATQRPSTDVITGIIKSNIPSRISFAVASSIDSRTILDQTGAERLLGNGDMLYAPQGENSPIRIQGVFVTDQEIKNITDFVKKERKPQYEDSYFEFLSINNNGGEVSSSFNTKEEDSLLNDVIEYITDVQKASTSLLQRRFGIGYNRAARIIETLEDRGMVGPAQGSKPREVYLKKETEE